MKKLLLVSSVVLLLAASCGKQPQQSQEVKSSQNQNQQTQVDQNSNNSPQGSEVVWKTYNSSQYSYTFKYPQNWYVDGDESDPHLSNKPMEDRPVAGQVVVEIQAFHSKAANTDLLTFCKTQFCVGGGMSPSGTISKVNLEGSSVIKVQHSGGEGADGPGYLVEKDSEHFIYVMVYGTAEEGTVNKIVASIKSTETARFSENLFSVTLPSGWKADHSKSFKVDAAQRFYYSDSNGNYFQVNVDPAGSDFASDMVWRYGVNPTKDISDGSITVSEEGKQCKEGDGFCSAGDNQLSVYLLSNSPGDVKIKGHDYYFIFGNTQKETGVDLKVFRSIISSFKAK